MGALQHRSPGRRRGLTPAVDLTTELFRPADKVWAAVTTPIGVNAELAPFLRMTFPADVPFDFHDAPRNQPLFASWLLAFGFIPFDRHTFMLAEAGERHFVETSNGWLQKLWRHERYVEPTRQGCTVRDVVTVVPRVGVMAPVARAIAAALFKHRHRRLKELYG